MHCGHVRCHERRGAPHAQARRAERVVLFGIILGDEAAEGLVFAP
jgi:hypothetical protein